MAFPIVEDPRIISSSTSEERREQRKAFDEILEKCEKRPWIRSVSDVSDPLDNPTPPLEILANPSRPPRGGYPPPPSPSPTAGGGPPPPLPGDKPQEVSKGGPLRTGRYSGILVP